MPTPPVLREDTYESSYSGPDYGFLQVHLTQGPFSLSKVKDVDPLELGTFLGNLGGFWGKYG